MISTNQAAKSLGITGATLSRYISAGKIPAPQTVMAGGLKVHSWMPAEIEHVRQLLPKIANGRKTRYKKKQAAVSTQQSAKTKKKAQPRAAVPHKLRKPKKKKSP
jgi:predicted DNA-binding transcriptional regulator AlpA